MRSFLPILGLFILSSHAVTYHIPKGRGPYETTFSEFELVDHSRPDPFNTSSPRRLMISRFDPIAPENCHTPYTKPYMSPVYSFAFEAVVAALGITLPPGFFTQFQQSFCHLAPNTSLPSLTSPSASPVILLSPGNAGSRTIYAALAQDLTSRGSTVLAIDHTSNAAVVEFPNGDIVPSVADTYPDLDSLLAAFVPVHAQDLSFILTHFGFTDTRHAKRAVAIGHSLGGTASISALSDRRFRAAINLDGPIFGGAQNSTIGARGRTQAAVLWQKESLADVPRQEDEWERFGCAVERSKHADFFARVALVGSQHYAFLDGPLLLDLAGLSGLEENKQAIEAAFGSVRGERLMQVMGVYVQTFVDYVFGREGEADIDIYRHVPQEFEEDVRVVS